MNLPLGLGTFLPNTVRFLVSMRERRMAAGWVSKSICHAVLLTG